MTRINVVPPEELSNDHLRTELYELPRVVALAYRSYKQGNAPVTIDTPPEYVLGKGHLKFFYSRLGYIERRFTALRIEADRRMVRWEIDPTTPVGLFPDGKPPAWFNDYEPTEAALKLNRTRLGLRHGFVGGTY